MIYLVPLLAIPVLFWQSPQWLRMTAAWLMGRADGIEVQRKAVAYWRIRLGDSK